MKSQTALSLPVSFHLVLIPPLVRKEELSILINVLHKGRKTALRNGKDMVWGVRVPWI